MIDHFHYYSEVLIPFIGSRSDGPGSGAQRFVFKRDPRHLNCVYFLHPTTQKYLPVPLAKMDRPAISLWDQRALIRQQLATNPDRKRLSEESIFRGLDSLEAMEKAAIRRTGTVTKAARRLLGSAPKSLVVKEKTAVPWNDAPTDFSVVPLPPEEFQAEAEPASAPPALFFSAVTPFDDLDNGASHC